MYCGCEDDGRGGEWAGDDVRGSLWPLSSYDVYVATDKVGR